MNRNPQEEIEEIEEEYDYVNAPACTVDKVATPPDQRFRFFTQTFLPIAVCWLILLVIMGLRIYYLTAVNQELETERKNLTGAIQNMETNWTKPNVSEDCQKGWRVFESSCYLFYDTDPPDQKTWEEAREDCRAQSSDLVVVDDDDEQDALSYYSWYRGSWIGLRAEEGRWKWIDGRDLTESVSYWIDEPPSAADGQCVGSVGRFRWRSVSCAERYTWICEKKALSV
ncbi:CD209 antigen-like protein C [Perca flavescens]|uniref:CD209 antigen-like protein C n=1 Tax=Perca flavescens TaxID=8167 RepID=UPI00106EFD2A|nr:CD209 antigen-like protein C [Perca flavescens]